jgi:hypothetical protein
MTTDNNNCYANFSEQLFPEDKGTISVKVKQAKQTALNLQKNVQPTKQHST